MTLFSKLTSLTAKVLWLLPDRDELRMIVAPWFRVSTAVAVQVVISLNEHCLLRMVLNFWSGHSTLFNRARCSHIPSSGSSQWWDITNSWCKKPLVNNQAKHSALCSLLQSLYNHCLVQVNVNANVQMSNKVELEYADGALLLCPGTLSDSDGVFKVTARNDDRISSDVNIGLCGVLIKVSIFSASFLQIRN